MNDLKNLVKDNNTAKFDYLRNGVAFYKVISPNGAVWTFPIELNDLAGASLFAEMKAITLMRYIRKSMEDGTFVQTGDV